MALYWTGLESGTVNEGWSAVGTFEVNSSVKYTGGYSFRANPTTTNNGYLVVGTFDANWKSSSTTPTTSLPWYTGFHFYAGALPPSGRETIASIWASGSVTDAICLNTDGTLAIYSGIMRTDTLRATSTYKLEATKWYYLEWKHASSSHEIKVDGVSVVTTTAFTGNTGVPVMGRRDYATSQSMDFYYDDIYHDTTGFKGTSTTVPVVVALKPNAAGNYSGWTNGTGTTFAEVDELTNDGDTTYIQASSTEDNQASTFQLESLPTDLGTIHSVKYYSVARTTSTASTSAVTARFRVSTTDYNGGSHEMSTGYVYYGQQYDTDPTTSSAWGTTNLNAVESGFAAGTIAQPQRFTAAGVFVLANKDRFAQSVSGTLGALTGTLTASKTYAKAIAGTLGALTGSITKKTLKALAGAFSTTYDTGWFVPDSITSSSALGGNTGWTSMTNARTDDASYATVQLNEFESSYYIWSATWPSTLTSIPNAAIINEIRVRWNGYNDGSSMTGLVATIDISGPVVLDEKSPGWGISGTETWHAYEPGDTWGTQYTGADINNGNWGTGFKIQSLDPLADVWADAFETRIIYTVGGGPTGALTAIKNAGTQFNQAVAGTLGALTGGLVNKTLKALAGTVGALTGVVNKVTSVTRTGVLGAVTGVVNKLTSIPTATAGTLGALTGALTKTKVAVLALAGTLGALTGNLTRTTLKALSGASGALTGALSRVTLKGLSGTLGALTGTVNKMNPRALAGTLGALTGNVTRITLKSLAGTLGALTGALSRVTLKALAGTLGALTGTLSRTTLKALSGTLGSLTGAISRVTLKALTGTLGALSAALAAVKQGGTQYMQDVAGTLGALTGAFSRAVTYVAYPSGMLGANLSGALSRNTLKSLSGTIGSITGNINKTISKKLYGIFGTTVDTATAWNFTGSVTNDTSEGGDNWAPTNAFSADDGSLSVSPPTGSWGTRGFSAWAKATTFGFSIPSGAVVTGIEVEVEGYSWLSPDYSTGLKAEKLVIDGVIAGPDFGNTTAFLNSGGTKVNMGGISNLWGAGYLTPTQINSSLFGVAIKCEDKNVGSTIAGIDYIKMKVYYTEYTPFTANLFKRFPVNLAGAIGGVYTGLTGAVTTSLQRGVSLTGTLGALSGNITRKTLKNLDGSLSTITGYLFKGVPLRLAGTLGALTGSLTQIRTYVKAIDGTLGALTGNVTKTVAYVRTLTGTLGALTGALNRITTKTVTGVAGALTGNVSKITLKALSGTLGALTGAVGTIKAYTRALGGTLGALTGDVSRTTLKSLSGTIGAITGVLSTFKTGSGNLYNQAVDGTLGALSGAMSRITLKSLGGAFDSIVGNVTKRTTKSMSGTLGALTGAVATAKLYIRPLAGTLGAMTGTISKKTLKSLSGNLPSMSGAVSSVQSFLRPKIKMAAGWLSKIGIGSSGYVQHSDMQSGISIRNTTSESGYRVTQDKMGPGFIEKQDTESGIIEEEI